MYANDHKIQDMGVGKCIFISFYVVNQYHTKSAISVFLLQKLFNYNYKMLQNNVICE